MSFLVVSPLEVKPVAAWNAGGLDFVVTEGEVANNADGYRHFLYVSRAGRPLERIGHDTIGQCRTHAWHLSTPLPAFAEDDLAEAAAEFDTLRRFTVEPMCGVSGDWFDPSDDDATTLDFGFASEPTLLPDANGQFGYHRELA